MLRARLCPSFLRTYCEEERRRLSICMSFDDTSWLSLYCGLVVLLGVATPIYRFRLLAMFISRVTTTGQRPINQPPVS